MPALPLYAGIDLGTSAIKGVVLDAVGHVVARSRSSYPTARPEPGAAEQEPTEWLRALRDVVASLSTRSQSGGWAGIGLAGMVPTLVLLGTAADPIGPAITWEDARSERESRELVAAVGDGHLYELTGQRVDGRYLLPMLTRISRHEPERVARTATLASAKDYLFSVLTGEILTDPSTATGYGCYDLDGACWSTEVLAASGVRAPALPDVEPSQTRRPLGQDAAEWLGLQQGLPVALGAADSVLGAWATGAAAPGDVAYLGGTSTVVLGTSATATRDPGRRCIVTPLAATLPEGGAYGLEMDLLATGRALGWMATLLGCDEAGILALACELPPGEGPSFLPFLGHGEQGALWEPALRGTITGLSVHHGRSHLARGLVTGIVLESRRCLQVIDDLVPAEGRRLLLGGHAIDDPFPHDLADACARPAHDGGLDHADHSAIGAAMLAAWSEGGAISPVPTRPTVEIEPRPSCERRWGRLFSEHERTLEQVRELYASSAVPNDSSCDLDAW